MARWRNIGGAILVLFLLTTSLAVGEERSPDGEFTQSLDEGLRLMREKKWDDSIRLFDRLARRFPQRWEGHFHLGVSYFQTGRYPEAEKALDQAVRIDPERPEIHLQRAFLFEATGRLPEAFDAYDRVIQVNPLGKWVELSLLKKRLIEGIMQARGGNFESALRLFREAAQMAPEDPDPHYNIGLVHLRRKEDSSAEAAFLKVIALEPAYQDAYLQLGNMYDRQGRMEEAFGAFVKGAEVNPQSPAGRSAMVKIPLIQGILLARGGAFDQALRAFEQALGVSSDPAPIYFNMAQIYLRQGDLARGEQALNRTLQFDPKHQGAALKLGILYEQQGKLEEALLLYDRAHGFNPLSSEGINALVSAHTVRGRLAARDGKLDEALAEFERTTRIQPENAANFYNVGQVHLQRKDLAEAEKAFRQVIALDPSEGDAYIKVGDIQEATGRKEEALRTYEQFIATGSGPVLNRAKVRFHLLKGVVLGEEGKFAEASREFEEVTRIDPKERKGYSNLGLAHLRNKKPDAALAAFKKMLELDPADLSTRYRVATIYEELARPTEAFDIYQALLEEEGADPLFLDEVRERMALLFSTLSIGYQVNFDSNINLSKDGISDLRSDLLAQYQRLFDFGAGWRGGLRLSPNFSVFHRSQQSLFSSQAGIFGERRGYQRGISMGYNFRVGLFEGSLSSRSHELVVDGFTPAGGAIFFGAARVQYTESIVNRAYTGIQPALSGSLSIDRFWGGRWIVGGALFGNFNTHEEGENYAYVGGSPSLSYDLLVTQGVFLNLSYNYTYSRYLNTDSVFGDKRVNQGHSVGAGITVGLEKGLQVFAKGSWQINRSNLEGTPPTTAEAQTLEQVRSLGDYDRFLGMAGIRLLF